jgi:hypothetical protein
MERPRRGFCASAAPALADMAFVEVYESSESHKMFFRCVNVVTRVCRTLIFEFFKPCWILRSWSPKKESPFIDGFKPRQIPLACPLLPFQDVGSIASFRIWLIRQPINSPADPVLSSQEGAIRVLCIRRFFRHLANGVQPLAPWSIYSVSSSIMSPFTLEIYTPHPACINSTTC